MSGIDPNTIPLVNPAAANPQAGGHPVLIDYSNNVLLFRDITQGGRIVQMDLGMPDVHVDRPLATYAAGFAVRQQHLIADKVMPVILVDKASDYYTVWDKDDAFQEVKPTVGTAGANVAEVTPRHSTAPFITVQYALRTYLPTEVEANADPALKLGMRFLNLPLQKLLLSRELRCSRVTRTVGSYTATHLKALAAAEKWNGGASSDPVRNILDLCEASLAPITGVAMSERVYNSFTQNAAVQKYVASKTAIKPRPGVENAAEWQAILELPPIIVGRQKWKNSATTYDYIWGNDVVLFTHPGVMPPMGDPISWNTFRFAGGLGSGVNVQQAAVLGQVSMEQGWGVRTYYDPTRGAQGGKACVAFHQDSETFVEEAVSGLITGAWQ